MKRVINKIKKHASGKTVLIFLSLTLLGEIILSYSNSLFSTITNLPSTLDSSFFYGASFANDFFKKISPEGATHYLKFAAVDMLFPLAYSIFIALLIAYLLKKKNIKNSQLESLILLPFIPMIFDYLENITTIILMNSLPVINSGLIYLLTVASSIKWGSMFITLIIFTGLLLVKKSKNQLNNSI